MGFCKGLELCITSERTVSKLKGLAAPANEGWSSSFFGKGLPAVTGVCFLALLVGGCSSLHSNGDSSPASWLAFTPEPIATPLPWPGNAKADNTIPMLSAGAAQEAPAGCGIAHFAIRIPDSNAYRTQFISPGARSLHIAIATATDSSPASFDPLPVFDTPAGKVTDINVIVPEGPATFSMALSDGPKKGSGHSLAVGHAAADIVEGVVNKVAIELLGIPSSVSVDPLGDQFTIGHSSSQPVTVHVLDAAGYPIAGRYGSPFWIAGGSFGTPADSKLLLDFQPPKLGESFGDTAIAPKDDLSKAQIYSSDDTVSVKYDGRGTDVAKVCVAMNTDPDSGAAAVGSCIAVAPKPAPTPTPKPVMISLSPKVDVRDVSFNGNSGCHFGDGTITFSGNFGACGFMSGTMTWNSPASTFAKPPSGSGGVTINESHKDGNAIPPTKSGYEYCKITANRYVTVNWGGGFFGAPPGEVGEINIDGQFDFYWQNSPDEFNGFDCEANQNYHYLMQ